MTRVSSRRGAVRVADCRRPLLPLDPIKGLSMPRWAWTGRTGGRTEVERSPWGRVASETGQRVRRWVAIDAPVPARVAADEGRCHARFRLSRTRRTARWPTRHSLDRGEHTVPAPPPLAPPTRKK